MAGKSGPGLKTYKIFYLLPLIQAKKRKTEGV